jgi:hypothetical protein
MAVAYGLSEVLAPISTHFEEKSDLLEQMNKMTGSQ